MHFSSILDNQLARLRAMRYPDPDYYSPARYYLGHGDYEIEMGRRRIERLERMRQQLIDNPSQEPALFKQHQSRTAPSIPSMHKQDRDSKQNIRVADEHAEKGGQLDRIAEYIDQLVNQKLALQTRREQFLRRKMEVERGLREEEARLAQQEHQMLLRLERAQCNRAVAVAKVSLASTRGHGQSD